jgi:hypothetical protein
LIVTPSPDQVAVADLEAGRLALVLQILRRTADHRVRVDPVLPSQRGVSVHDRPGADLAPVSDRHVRPDRHERPDLDVVSDPGPRVNPRPGIDRHRRPLSPGANGRPAV